MWILFLAHVLPDLHGMCGVLPIIPIPVSPCIDDHEPGVTTVLLLCLIAARRYLVVPWVLKATRWELEYNSAEQAIEDVRTV